MILSWWKRRRRARWIEEGLSPAAQRSFDALSLHALLDDDERQRLAGMTRVFVEEKHWEGCGGQPMDEEVRVVIAAQACLLILNLHHDFYHRVGTILVYPSTFRNPMPETDATGVVWSRDDAHLGEAWPGGPVVLAWDAALLGARRPDDGRNTVLHEFAHKLDMLDDFADGVPPLGGRAAPEEWQAVCAREREALEAAARAGRPTLLDPYGATDEAEFFAVATEAFFELPREMALRHADLYRLLCALYRQDPAARLKRRREGRAADRR